MVARITGRSIAKEARTSSCSFDLVKKISQRSLRWLGHLLRVEANKAAEENTLTYHALLAQFEMHKRAGNLFLDAPHFDHPDQLQDLAQDRSTWGARVAQLV